MDLLEESGFGRLDPSNFGLTINLDAALRRADFQQLAQLMWTTLHFETNQGHFDYVADSPDVESATFAATCFTAYPHEARHFHDLLATPYGATLGRLFTRAGVMYQLLFGSLLASPAVAVPLRDWVQSAGVLRRVFPDLPEPSANIRNLEAIYADIQHKFEVANRGWVGAEIRNIPTASSLLECSATIVQQMLIAERFGLPIAEEFGRGILSRHAAERYFGPLQMLQDACGTPVPQVVAHILCVASLYGDALDPSDRPRYPSDVFLDLLRWLSEKRTNPAGIRSLDVLVSLIQDYYLDCHGRDLEAMVLASTAANDRMLNSLDEAVGRWEESTGRPATAARQVLDGYAYLARAQNRLANTVARNPGDFFGQPYRDKLYDGSLPTAPVQIATSVGLPIGRELDPFYVILDEDTLHIPAHAVEHMASLPELSEAQRAWIRNADRAVDGGVMLRNAYLMWPRDPTAAPDSDAEQDPWRRSRLALAGFRLFFEGPANLGTREVANMVGVLQAAGTAVYWEDGLLEGSAIDIAGLTPDGGELLRVLRSAQGDVASG